MSALFKPVVLFFFFTRIKVDKRIYFFKNIRENFPRRSFNVFRQDFIFLLFITAVENVVQVVTAHVNPDIFNVIHNVLTGLYLYPRFFNMAFTLVNL